MGLWFKLSNQVKPLLNAFCSLSSKFARISLYFTQNEEIMVELEAIRHARLPKALFKITDEPEAIEAAKSLKATDDEILALRLVLQNMQKVFNPHKKELLEFLKHHQQEKIVLTRSLAMDKNFPAGEERHGDEASFSIEEALEESLTHEVAMEAFRILTHEQHPLSHTVLALISDQESQEIQSVVTETLKIHAHSEAPSPSSTKKRKAL